MCDRNKEESVTVADLKFLHLIYKDSPKYNIYLVRAMHSLAKKLG